MANKTAKLTVVAVDNHYQQFGSTDYVTVIAETADKNQIPIAMSHNMLRKTGISEGLFDSLAGSHIIVKDDTDIRTGEFLTADERVQQVVDKVPNRTILLCNGANALFAKSEQLIAEMKDINASISAKVAVEKDRERRLLNAKRRAERLASSTSTAVSAPAGEPALEDNEDAPF